MGPSSDQIAQELSETRQDAELRVVELRRRGDTALARGRRLAVYAGIGAVAILVGVGAVVVVRRYTRPASPRERLSRLVPGSWLARAGRLREAWELGLRRQVPQVRLYVGDREVGAEPPGSRAMELGRHFVKTTATATGAAIATYVLHRITGTAKPAHGGTERGA